MDLALQLIDEKIAELEMRVKAWKALRASAAKHPDIVSELHEVLIQEQQFRVRRESEEPDEWGSTAYHRVVRWMLASPEEPQTVAQICRGTKMDKGAVLRALYVAKHSKDFVSELVPGHTRNVRWRLRPEAVNRIRAIGVLQNGQSEETRPKRGPRRHRKGRRGRR